MSAMTIFYQQCPVCGRNLRNPGQVLWAADYLHALQGRVPRGEDELPEAPRSTESQVSAGCWAPGVFRIRSLAKSKTSG